MMTPLHPIFGPFWGILTLATIANVWWGGPLPWWVDAINFTLFTVAEAWAVFHNKEVTWEGQVVALRDTLSEFMTWVARRAKPGARWYQSWNGAVAAIAVHWAALVFRQFDNVIFGAVAGAFLFGFLLWHWLRPDTKG